MGVVGNFLVQFIPLLALWFWGISGTANLLPIVAVTLLVVMPACVLLTVVNVGENDNFEPTQLPLCNCLYRAFDDYTLVSVLYCFCATCRRQGALHAALFLYG